MEARIDIITLAVTDLERALDFYRDGLGLQSRGVIGTEYVGDDVNPAGALAMFELRDGLILALYPRTELAKDANVPLGPPRTGEFSLGHAVASKAEVDALLTQAQAAGATLTDQPHDRPWGIYSGYFRDPDGHLWEILLEPTARRLAGVTDPPALDQASAASSGSVSVASASSCTPARRPTRATIAATAMIAAIT